MPRKKNKQREEKTYEIPDIDARLAAMKCQHTYSNGHEVGCDKCHYIPFIEDREMGAVDTTRLTADVYNNPMLIGSDFNEFIENMHLQNAISKTTYEDLKKKSPAARRDAILAELKERYTKGKLSEKKYTQMVIATHMQY